MRKLMYKLLAYIWLMGVPEMRGFVMYEEVVKVLALEMFHPEKGSLAISIFKV